MGSNATSATVDEVQHYSRMPGLAALMVVTSTARSPLRRVSASTFEPWRAPVGFLSSRTTSHIGPVCARLQAAELLELATAPGIVGVKQTVGALDADTLELLRQKPAGFRVLCGDDALIAPMLLMGASGAIAASAHLCTAQFAAVSAAARAGRADEAVKLAEMLLPVVRAGFAEPNPTCWKGALFQLGEIPSATVRLPLQQASAWAVKALLTAANR